MNTKNCQQCGAPLKVSAQECAYCGEEFNNTNSTYQQSENPGYAHNLNQELPEKSRVAAVLFAFLLGSIGIHLFYLNKPLRGIIYLLFAFTGITFIFALIDFIIYLTASKEYFEQHYKVRIV